MDLQHINTDRLILREWTEADIKPFAEMNANTEVMKYFPKTLSEDETISSVHRILNHFKKHGFGLFAVEDKLSKKFIGFTGFAIPAFESDFTPCVEIGWRFKKEYWGQGLATEAANACLKLGFHELDFDKVLSFTAKINIKSERVMQRIGMSYVKDFYHPQVDSASILCKHVLYELTRENYLQTAH